MSWDTRRDWTGPAVQEHAFSSEFSWGPETAQKIAGALIVWRCPQKYGYPEKSSIFLRGFSSHFQTYPCSPGWDGSMMMEPPKFHRCMSGIGHSQVQPVRLSRGKRPFVEAVQWLGRGQDGKAWWMEENVREIISKWPYFRWAITVCIQMYLGRLLIELLQLVKICVAHGWYWHYRCIAWPCVFCMLPAKKNAI